MAAALLHDAVHGGEAEPGSLPLLLGGEERLEDVGGGLRAHAGTGVAHREGHVGPRREVGPARRGRLADLDVANGDPDAPAARHGVARVHREVHEDLLHLARIDLHPPRALHRLDHQLDVLPDHALEHRDQLRHEGPQLDHPRLHDLLAAEGQELARERHRALRRLLDQLDVAVHRLAGLEPAQQHVRPAGDHGEQVVEVVGDPAREPADRLHLLGLLELHLQARARGVGPPLLGEVADVRAERGRAAHPRGGHGQLHRELGAVGAQGGHLDAAPDDRALAGREVAGQPLSVRVPVCGRHDHRGELLAQDVRPRDAEHPLGGRIELGHPALVVHAHEGVHRRLDHRAMPRLALAEDRLRALALGDVDHGADHAHRASRAVPHEPSAILHLQVAAVAGPESVLGLEVAAFRRGGLDLPVHPRPIVRMKAIDPPFIGPAHLVERVAAHLGEARGPHHGAVAEAPVVDRGLHRGGGHLEALVGLTEAAVRDLDLAAEPARAQQRVGLEQGNHEGEHADQEPAAENRGRDEPIRARVEGGQRGEVERPGVAAEGQREPVAELPRDVGRPRARVAVVKQALRPRVGAVVDLEVHRLPQRGAEDASEHEVGTERRGHESFQIPAPLLDGARHPAPAIHRDEDDKAEPAVRPQEHQPLAHRGLSGVAGPLEGSAVPGPAQRVETERPLLETGRLEEDDREGLRPALGRVDLVRGSPLPPDRRLVTGPERGGHPRGPADPANALVAPLEPQRRDVGSELASLHLGAAGEERAHPQEDLHVGIEAPVDRLPAHRDHPGEALLLVGPHGVQGVAPGPERQQQRAAEDDVGGPGATQGVEQGWPGPDGAGRDC